MLNNNVKQERQNKVKIKTGLKKKKNRVGVGWIRRPKDSFNVSSLVRPHQLQPDSRGICVSLLSHQRS